MGETCIKSGFRHGDKADYFVTKIASSHPRNVDIGLSPSSGVMLLFSQLTGKLVCLLQDDGYLTDLRTAVASSLAVATFGPRNIRRIGIVGTGVQALLQLEMLRNITDCREVTIFGRNEGKLASIQKEAKKLGYTSVLVTKCAAEVASSCNVIITVTSSSEPLLMARDIRPGSLIIAMGADGLGKQELDPHVMSPDIIDLVLVDSSVQCCGFGEASHAIKAGCLQVSECIEIGHALTLLEMKDDISSLSEDEKEIYYNCNIRAGDKRPSTGLPYSVVFDSTGVAIQDVQVAEAVFNAHMARQGKI